jgi:hypothetical protein
MNHDDDDFEEAMHTQTVGKPKMTATKSKPRVAKVRYKS